MMRIITYQADNQLFATYTEAVDPGCCQRWKWQGARLIILINEALLLSGNAFFTFHIVPLVQTCER